MSNGKAKFVEFLVIRQSRKSREAKVGIRRCRCEDADKHQANYLNGIASTPMTTISSNTAFAIYEEANAHIPYEFFEIKPDDKKVKVQRNGVIEETVLPDHIKLTIELAFNQAVGDKMRWMCQQPGVKEIQIAQQGEELILKTANTAVTCDLTGIESFYSKTPKPIKQIKYFIASLHEIKEIIRECQNHPQAKKFDNAILYLDNKLAVIAFIDDSLEFEDVITDKEIEQTEMTTGYLMFRFSMRKLVSMKISNLITASSVKLSIIDNGNGEFSLGIYQSLKQALPTNEIPLEKDEYLYPREKQLREKLIIAATKAKIKARETHEAQQDMFGYGNLDCA